MSMIKMIGTAVSGLAALALLSATPALAEPAAYPVKAAALLIGSLLATPFILDYDLMLLAPAIAFLAADGMQRGFGPYEKSMLAALWIAPLIARSAAQTVLLPLGVLAMLAAFALLLRRAIAERAPRPHGILDSTA